MGRVSQVMVTAIHDTVICCLEGEDKSGRTCGEADSMRHGGFLTELPYASQVTS